MVVKHNFVHYLTKIGALNEHFSRKNYATQARFILASETKNCQSNSIGRFVSLPVASLN